MKTDDLEVIKAVAASICDDIICGRFKHKLFCWGTSMSRNIINYVKINCHRYIL